MIRISLPWLIEAFLAIDNLDKIQVGQKLSEFRYALFKAQQQLDHVYMNSVYGAALRSSRDHAQKMRNSIDDILGKDDEYVFSELQIWTLNTSREQFKTVFMAEVSIFPAYFVTQKGAHDTLILIDDGIKLFPPNLLSKAPETKLDADEVGKALAFELSTACGFHAFRIVEAVLRRYWDEVSNGKARPEPQTLGTMAAQLGICKFGDSKVIESLKQMTKLHRNPISHPDVILNVDEAIAILGMGRSVVTHMLAVLKDVPLTTGAVAQTGPV